MINYNSTLQPKLVGLVRGSAATWHCMKFIKWIRLILALSVNNYGSINTAPVLSPILLPSLGMVTSCNAQTVKRARLCHNTLTTQLAVNKYTNRILQNKTL